MAKKMTEAEKTALMEMIFAKMPPLPKNLENDVMKYALPGSRYLFFKNGIEGGKKFSTALCTTCGKTVRFEGMHLQHTTQKKMRYSKSGAYKMICPECEAVAVTMAARYGHKWLEDTAHYMTIQATEDGGLFLRMFTVRRCYPDNAGPFVTEYDERLRVYLNAETHTALRWKRVFRYDPEDAHGWSERWELSGKVNKNTTSTDYYRAGDIIVANNAATVREIAKTPFRYADFCEMADEFPKMDKIAYLALFARNPNIEKLMKAGFRWLVAEKLYSRPDCDAINWRAKDLRGFFRGENMPTIRAYRENRLSDRKIKAYREMRALLGLGMEQNDFRLAWAMYGYKEFIESMAEELGTPARVRKYVRQQLNIAKKHTDKTCNSAYALPPSEESVWDTWRDYVRIAALCHIQLHGKELTTPDIYKAHDEMTELYRVQREAEKSAKRAKEEAGLMDDFEKRLKVLQPYTYTKEGLLIRPCETPHEMTEEGVKLRHCVGTYLHRHANGTSNIFLIRKETEPDAPYYTLELSKALDRVVQWYGYEDNRTIPKDPAVKEFIGDWMAKIVLPKKRSKKKAGKQAPAGQVKNRQPIAVAV